MNFTREPIVETVVSPREGHKLVIRNSKSAGQEEYLVDAIEIVRFGSALFFRSLERPKSFILPVSDYEVLEVRETRVVLKHAVAGEKPSSRPEKKKEKKEEEAKKEEPKPKRRRQRRRKRDEATEEQSATEAPAGEESAEESAEQPSPLAQKEQRTPSPSTLLPPPTTLIKESIGHYKQLMTEAQSAGPVEKSDAGEPVSTKLEEPALVPPGAEPKVAEEAGKGLGIASAGRFLRRLAGQEKDEGEATPEEE